MDNFGKYKDSITRSDFALVNGEIKNCSNVRCIKECDFYSELEECTKIKWEWLKEEYVENIPKDTPIDTKVLVSDDGENWYRRYYAGFDGEKHYVWASGATSWSINHEDLGCKTSWLHMKLAEEE